LEERANPSIRKYGGLLYACRWATDDVWRTKWCISNKCIIVMAPAQLLE
jgi:hypothetical protein